eukprot:403358485
MAGPLPPGNEAAYKALVERQITEEFLGVQKNDLLPELSTFKGRSYVYRFDDNLDPQQALVKQLRACNQFMKQTGLNKSREVKHPTAMRRIFGQVNPGETERRERKTMERKTTRAQANLLCKYMLYKKGKFVPGKMV